MKMIKCITALFFAAAINLLPAATVTAANVPLVVEYTTGIDQISTDYTLKLWVEKVPDSSVKVLLGTTNVDAEAPWNIDVTDVPNGKKLNYYLSVVDPDGDEVFSPAYQFKITGNPHLLKVEIAR